MSRGSSLVSFIAALMAAFCCGFFVAETMAPARKGTARGVAEVLGIGAYLERQERLAAEWRAMDQSALESVLHVVEGELSGLSECEIRPFVDAWSRIDAEQALARISGWPYSSKRVIGLDALVYSLAVVDPIAGRQMSERIQELEPKYKGRLDEMLAAGWAYGGHADLYEGMLGRLPVGPPLNLSATSALAGMTRRKGPEYVADWADHVLATEDREPHRRLMFQRVARALSRRDWRIGLAWVSSHAGQSYAEDGLRIVSEYRVAIDPIGTLRWLGTQAEGTPRAAALRAAAAKAVRRNPTDVEAWLSGRDPDVFFDPAIDMYARHLVTTNPSAAVAWSEQILDDRFRAASLTAVGKQWYRRDPVAAERWLSDSSLDEDRRRRVRDPR